MDIEMANQSQNQQDQQRQQQQQNDHYIEVDTKARILRSALLFITDYFC